jgi:hypothetical protein
MKKLLAILVLGLLTININCGGGSGGTSTSAAGRTTVTINLGETRTASRAGEGLVSASSIPTSVVSIRFVISAPDMATIERVVSVAGKTAISESFDIPNGANRDIVVEAMDALGNIVFRGETFANFDGRPVTLIIIMVSTDKTPPVFSGISSIGSITTTSMTLSWSAATDNVTPQENIQYLIYMSTTSGGENFATPSFTTTPGATSFNVPGLNPDTVYYFVVRAMDEAGNIDSNTVEMSARTLAPPDVTAPVFGGLVSATASSPTSIDLQWNPASDNRSAPSAIVYLVYMSATSGGQNFAVPSFTTTAGATSFSVPGLTPNTTYYFVVRARDEAGNMDANTVEKSATTLASLLSVSPPAASVAGLTNPDGLASDDVTFTISGGTAPYSVTSSNISLISSPGTIAGNIFTVDPNSTCSGAAVTLTVTDSAGRTTTATVNITTPHAVFSPFTSICENNNACAAGSETLLLTLSGVAPFTLTSGTPSVIPSPGVISGYTYTIDAIDNSISANTNVLLTLTDSCGDTFDAFITVINQGAVGLADLQPESGAVIALHRIGYTVANNGGTDANNVTVWVEYGDMYSSTCLPRTISVPAGGTFSDAFGTFPIAPTIFTIVVDPNNTIPESNENNNCLDSGSGGCSFPPSSCPPS